MKKVYLSMVALFAGIALVNAQAPTFESNPSAFERVNDIPEGFVKKYQASSQSATERWYGYWNSKNQFNGKSATGDQSLIRTFLFPDSLGIFGFGPTTAPTSWGPAGIHSLANTIDPTADVLNDALFVPGGELLIRNGDSYTVDSVGLPLVYYRFDTTSVDTLIIRISNGGTTALNYYLATGTFVAQYTAKNPATDTLFFRGVPYSSAINTTTVAPYIERKIVMDSAWTADSVTNHFYSVEVSAAGLPPMLAGNNYPTVAISFKPGYSYSLGDTIFNKKNYASIYSFEEFGATPNNSSAPSTVPFIIEGDYNMSHIANRQVRYNNAGNWNGLYLPTIAYNPSYVFENHYINWKLSCSTCGAMSTNNIDENVAKLGNVYPNPAEAGGSIIIPVSLSKAGNVDIKFYNTIGQLVKSVEATDLNAGLNKITVNTASFNAGVYLYSMEIDGKTQATSRFSVVK